MLVIKYVLPPYPGGFGTSYGIANVVQSVAIMLRYALSLAPCAVRREIGLALTVASPLRSAVVLWTAQNSETEYDYQLTL